MVLEKLNYLAECITQDLIQYLMEDYNIIMEKAMDIVYKNVQAPALITHRT